MQASSVSVSQSKPSGMSRSTTMLSALLLTGATLLGAAPQARADDGQVILATGLGAVAGALIGHSVGGRSGTVVGGAVGAAIGASAAQGSYNRGPAANYSSGYYQGGYAPVAPVVYAPPVRVYRPTPIYEPVYQPVYRTVVRPVVVPVVYRGDYRGSYHDHYDSDNRHGSRGWDRGRHDNRFERNGHGHDRGSRGWDNDRGNSGHRR